jgi:hypothetical protein
VDDAVLHPDADFDPVVAERLAEMAGLHREALGAVELEIRPEIARVERIGPHVDDHARASSFDFICGRKTGTTARRRRHEKS